MRLAHYEMHYDHLPDPLVGAAAVTAGGAIAGGIMNARASGRASRMSWQSSQEAIALQREIEAKREAAEKERLALEKAQWEARENRKAEILARYGRSYAPRPHVPGMAPSQQPPAPPPTMAPPQTLGGMFGASRTGSRTPVRTWSGYGTV